MIADWQSYAVADFVPFSAEVYFRLVERANETLWPLHGLMIAAGVAALVLVVRDRGRTAIGLLAATWAFVGPSFLMQRYATLSWVGPYFGWAFLVEAALLLAMAVSGRGIAAPGQPLTAPRLAGLVIAAGGLAGYPLLAPLAGRGWMQAEVFGMLPEPTAVVTLGLCLACLRGGWLWAASAPPGLWCLVAGLSLSVLGTPWAPALFVAAALAVVGPWWAGTQRRT